MFRWLRWLAQKDKLDIRHARNGQEVKIGGLKVDGFCEATNTVYEFNGCKLSALFVLPCYALV
jgi:hypothetical protein